MALEGTLDDGVQVFNAVSQLEIDELKAFDVLIDDACLWVVFVFGNRVKRLLYLGVMVVAGACVSCGSKVVRDCSKAL